MKGTRIVVVEDEEKIAQLLKDYLSQDSFQVTLLNTGEGAVDFIREHCPDFVILDRMLPGMDGLTICKEIRAFSQVPIMMLTARVDEIDRLMGLEMGADDYVCKPFLPREVVARVKVILRRTGGASDNPEEQISYKQIQLLPERFLCRVADAPVELTPVEFRMLKAMISVPGRVYSRDSLMKAAYPDDRIVSDRTIDSHIKNLRKKLLDAAGDEQELIHSVYGVGYKVE
ncbi:response regulator [Granulosicoccaceae sp. 1_MG-2023]|nr:response regulator [Granulosicoccaceae sp. 1_MG-2023]